MVPGTSSTQVHRPHPYPAPAGRPRQSRAGQAVAFTVGGPVGVFATGYGMARDAQLTGWLLLILLIGSGGFVVMRWVLRSWAGPR